MSDFTYFYGDETSRMRAAQDLYERYCQYLYTDPARAKTQMIAGVQSALAQAFAQGTAERSTDPQPERVGPPTPRADA